jgi:DNA-binding NarL/FixJ family response regulator
MARVLVLVRDLMLASRIREGLAASGTAARFLPDTAALRDAVARGGDEPPGLVLADLSISGDDSIGALAELKAGALAGVHVVGFYSHVDQATRDRATSAGIDEVLPRSAFFARLPELLAAPGR